jgi:hypothetical protein
MRMSACASKRKCQKLHFDQRRGDGRRIALQDHPGAIVDGGAQRRKRLLDLPLAVVAIELQRPGALPGAHAAALVDALHRPHQVAEHRLAAVGIASREAFDHRKLDRPRALCVGEDGKKCSRGQRFQDRATRIFHARKSLEKRGPVRRWGPGGDDESRAV